MPEVVGKQGIRQQAANLICRPCLFSLEDPCSKAFHWLAIGTRMRAVICKLETVVWKVWRIKQHEK